jgi:hypothetical protein
MTCGEKNRLDICIPENKKFGFLRLPQSQNVNVNDYALSEALPHGSQAGRCKIPVQADKVSR